MKKAVVKGSVPFLTEGKQVPNEHGVYAFTVTFDNNDCGYYYTKDKEGAPFIVGQESEYEIEKPAGKSYFKISRPQQNKGGWSGGGKSSYVPKTPEQIKFETRLGARSMVLRYACDLFIADKIKYEEIGATYDTLLGLYDGAIADITLG